jgi:hypothetical protein
MCSVGTEPRTGINPEHAIDRYRLVAQLRDDAAEK